MSEKKVIATRTFLTRAPRRPGYAQAERLEIMSESWRVVRADEVRAGDVVRTTTGDVVLVTRVESSFLGRPNMLAFIEDTPERWYKRPVVADADVEIRTG
jgi:hypothetical protein